MIEFQSENQKTVDKIIKLNVKRSKMTSENITQGYTWKAHNHKLTHATAKERIVLHTPESKHKAKGGKLNIDTAKIATWMANNLILDDVATAKEKYSYIKTELDKLTKQQRSVVCLAYVFAHKVPKAESEDMFQELSLALLESKHTKESCLYITAKHVWALWFKRWYLKSETEVATDFDYVEEVSQKIGINEIALEELEKVSPEIAEVSSKIREEVASRYEDRLAIEEFDSYQDYAKVSENGKAKAILDKLPQRVKDIAQAKVDGKPLSGKDRNYLCLWLKKNRNLIASSQS